MQQEMYTTEGYKTNILTDVKYGKKMAAQEKENKERDARMKYGKKYKQFMNQANDAKDRLRPGEVKRYDKNLKKWVSNKD